MTIGPEYGYWVNNMLARPTGLEVRKGWKRWLPFAYQFMDSLAIPPVAAEVRTIMYYANPSGVNDKLFCSTSQADSPIYDISTPDVNPTLSFTPGAGADIPGEWYWVNFATPSTSFLCAVAKGLGYYQYTSAGGWVKILDGVGPGQIDFTHNTVNYSASTMTFCFIWKNRLWFLQDGTTLAWYLPVNQVTGVAKAIDIGQFLRHGGGLAYAMSWTFDSGTGIDDNLIFVGTNGDMVIYQGTDPDTAANFSLRGQWYVGRIPVGRRGFCQYGGDVLIASEFGIMAVSELVSGKLANLASESLVGAKYNPSLSRYVSAHIQEKYWQLISYPTEEMIFVASPALEPEFSFNISFAMGHFAKAWSTISEFPAYCCEIFDGKFFFGTKDGYIGLGFSGHHDVASYDGSEMGNEVTGFFQTGFYDFGSPTANKRATRVRLLGRCDGTPGYIASVKSEYELETLLVAPGPVINNVPLWDVALWDQAVWQARSSTFKKWFGVAGFGKKLAVLIAVRGLGYTLLTDYELTFEEGGGL